MGGFARLRADEVLSPRGKVPKGRRGRPKGACLVAAPGPPVAKLQCTASLAGARPAGFTSVPGRATVAFKVGFHFVKAKSLRDPRIRLWRKRGLAQLIPPLAPRCRSILGVSARGCHGRTTLQRYMPRHRGHARCVPVAASDWLLAQGQTKWRARYGPCRSRDKRKYHSCAAFPSLHNRCCKKFAPFLARRAWKGAIIIRFFGESPVGVPRYRCAARLRARRFFFCPACHTTSTMSSTVPT